jgi:hypothetical protein
VLPPELPLLPQAASATTAVASRQPKAPLTNTQNLLVDDDP